MNKTKENNLFVWYKFEEDIYEKVSVSKKEAGTVVTKYGLCKLNKKTGEFQIDRKKTDPYFLKKDNKYKTVVVHVKLRQFWREKTEYPQITCFASC